MDPSEPSILTSSPLGFKSPEFVIPISIPTISRWHIDLIKPVEELIVEGARRGSLIIERDINPHPPLFFFFLKKKKLEPSAQDNIKSIKYFVQHSGRAAFKAAIYREGHLQRVIWKI
jgi:hypothetical protein